MFEYRDFFVPGDSITVSKVLFKPDTLGWSCHYLQTTDYGMRKCRDEFQNVSQSYRDTLFDALQAFDVHMAYILKMGGLWDKEELGHMKCEAAYEYIHQNSLVTELSIKHPNTDKASVQFGIFYETFLSQHDKSLAKTKTPVIELSPSVSDYCYLASLLDDLDVFSKVLESMLKQELGYIGSLNTLSKKALPKSTLDRSIENLQLIPLTETEEVPSHRQFGHVVSVSLV